MTHDKCQTSHQQNKKESLSFSSSCQWMNRFHIRRRPVKTRKTWQREERRMRTKVGWSVVRLQQFGRGQFGFCHARDLISLGLLKCQPCHKKRLHFLYSCVHAFESYIWWFDQLIMICTNSAMSCKRPHLPRLKCQPSCAKKKYRTIKQQNLHLLLWCPLFWILLLMQTRHCNK